MSGMLTLMPEGLCPWSALDKAAQWRQQFPRVFPPSIPRPQRLSLYSLQALLCNGHSQACRLAKGSLYTWSQSTPNSIILESGSRVASAKRLFTWAQTPQCYFASLGVFIMSVKGGQVFLLKRGWWTWLLFHAECLFGRFLTELTTDCVDTVYSIYCHGLAPSTLFFR